MYVVIFGSVCAGFEIVGPFQTRNEAVTWADRSIEVPIHYVVEKLSEPHD